MLAAVFCAGHAKDAVRPPTGLYLSAPDPVAILHPNARGTLIRVFWSQIEPSKGHFDFSPIQRQLDRVKASKKDWSLGVVAGPHAPEWLASEATTPTIDFNFRGTTPVRIPPQWDATVQERLRLLAKALAAEYNTDPKLRLVYVPQMSANGIEGHFNGCPKEALTRAGFIEDKWVKAVVESATSMAKAFDSKAIAVEVHEVLGSAAAAKNILNTLYKDKSLNGRVGAALWWLSGSSSYQPELLHVLADFPGDKYAQVISRSDDERYFPDGALGKVFEQAKQLGVRYIEPWETEFKSNRQDKLFADFQAWADKRFPQ